MDAYQVLIFVSQFGTDPSFWWMWESIALFGWWINRISKGRNANKYVVLGWTGAGWKKITEKWVKKGTKTWGKHGGRTNQPDAIAYTEPGFLSDHGVIFSDMKHTLPMRVTIETVPHNPKGKGEKYTVNPDVEDMEDLMGRQTVRKIIQSQMVGHPELTMLVICAAMGALAMYALYPFINPVHTVYVPGPPTTTTTTATVTVHQ